MDAFLSRGFFDAEKSYHVTALDWSLLDNQSDQVWLKDRPGLTFKA